MHLSKNLLRIITFRNFSNYRNKNLINLFNKGLNKGENIKSLLKDYDCFYKVHIEVLNDHAPYKKKYSCGNLKNLL